MFGRKKVGADLSPADRARLVEAYQTAVVEVDDTIERCSWFLDETRVSEVPSEYVAPLRDALDLAHANRAILIRRIEEMPTAPVVIDDLAREMNSIHHATVAADDLMRSAGADAATAIILKDLANKS